MERQPGPKAEARAMMGRIRTGDESFDVDFEKVKREAYAIGGVLLEKAWQSSVEQRAKNPDHAYEQPNPDSSEEVSTTREVSIEEFFEQRTSVSEFSSGLGSVLRGELSEALKSYFDGPWDEYSEYEQKAHRRLGAVLMELRDREYPLTPQKFVEQGIGAASFILPIVLTAGLAHFVRVTGRLPNQNDIQDISTALFPVISSLTQLNIGEFRALGTETDIVNQERRESDVSGMYAHIDTQITDDEKFRFSLPLVKEVQDGKFADRVEDEGVTVGCPAMLAQGPDANVVRELWSYTTNLATHNTVSLEEWQKLIDGEKENGIEVVK